MCEFSEGSFCGVAGTPGVISLDGLCKCMHVGICIYGLSKVMHMKAEMWQDESSRLDQSFWINNLNHHTLKQ